MAEYYFSKGSWVKDCSRCKRQYIGSHDEELAAKELSKNFCSNRGRPDGLHDQCKACHTRVIQTQAIGTILNREKMLNEQDGKCAICYKPINLVRTSHELIAFVDHDHSTNIVRSLLCQRCNTLMAAVDDEKWLSAAIDYKAKHETIKRDE